MPRLVFDLTWTPIEVCPPESGQYLISYGRYWREAFYDLRTEGWRDPSSDHGLKTPKYWAVVSTPDQLKIRRLVNLASMDAHAYEDGICKALLD